MQSHIPRPQESGRRRMATDDRTDDLERALRQKTALLHEVDHRVKNNLQLISSLLLLQARRAGDPAVKQALRSAQTRINAVAIVHRRLFQGEDPGAFDVAAFIRDMVADAIGMSGRGDIRVVLDLEPAELPASQAAPLALLFGELLGNTIGHAFPDGRAGTLSVLMVRETSVLRIEITDDGVGTGSAGAATGFGGAIVKLLSQQLHADCQAADANPGVRTVIRLPL